MRTIIRSIISLVLLAGVLTACSQNSSEQSQPRQPQTGTAATPAGSPQETSQALIRRYNQLLADGYRNLNMTPLQEVVTEDLANKAYYHMAAIGEGRNRMDSRLKSIEFVKTELLRPDRCQVQTREVWDYVYSEIATGKRVDAVNGYIYHVFYTVENKAGRWVITTIVANGDPDSEKKVSSWKKFLSSGNKKADNHVKPAGHPQ